MRLRYTRPALADLSAILNYIAARSPRGAKRVKARLRAVIDLLLHYPQLGRPTNDPAIRRIAATPYPYVMYGRPLMRKEFAAGRTIWSGAVMYPASDAVG